jgi:uncharacterized membrane protein YfcA
LLLPPLPFHPAWLIVGFAIFLIGITKSGFGSGMGLIVVPLTALGLAQLPPGEKAALGLLLPLLLIGDLIAVSQYRKLLNASLVRQLALPTLLGVGLGALLLLGIQRIGGRSEPLANALIRLEIGLESVVLVSLHFYTRWRSAGGGDRKLLPEPLRSILAGSYSGVSSTLAHAAGPVIALYLLPLKLPREAYVGTCAVYFAALNAAKLPAYYATGLFKLVSPGFALAWLPCVLAGALAGRWLVKRIPDKLFMNIVYGTTFIMGLYLLADATVRLLRLRA